MAYRIGGKFNKEINSSFSNIQQVLVIVTSSVICHTLLYIHAIAFSTLQHNGFVCHVFLIQFIDAYTGSCFGYYCK
jgi:hypothetical protein